jgi:hypothetical protein
MKWGGRGASLQLRVLLLTGSRSWCDVGWKTTDDLRLLLTLSVRTRVKKNFKLSHKKKDYNFCRSCCWEKASFCFFSQDKTFYRITRRNPLLKKTVKRGWHENNKANFKVRFSLRYKVPLNWSIKRKNNLISLGTTKISTQRLKRQ